MNILFSASGFWTAAAAVVLFSAALYFLTGNYKIYMHINPDIIIFAVSLIVLRCLLPVEISGARAVDVPDFLTWLNQFLSYPVFKIGYANGYINISVLFILVQIWICIACINLGKLIREYRKIRKRLSLLKNVDGRLLEISEEIKAELGIKGSVIYKISEDEVSPFIFGLICGIIVFPSYCSDFSEEDWRIILMHELNHYKKRDGITKIGLCTFYLFFWWLPFKNSLVNRLEEAIEMRTDRDVVQYMSEEEKTLYLKILYSVSEKTLKNAGTQDSTFFSGYTGMLEARFRLIIESRKKRKKNLIAAILCCCLFCSSYFWVIQPLYKPDFSDLSRKGNCTVVIQKDGMYKIYLDNKYQGIAEDIEFLQNNEFKNINIRFRME